MKKRLATLIMLLLLFIPARAEEALTVNGMAVSAAEARLYLINAESSYADIVAYYRDLLGLDYWTLTTANGMTAAEAVKSDVFRELITMNIFCRMAQESGLRLSDAERAACAEDARAYYASLTVSESSGISCDDVAALIEKQRLADRMYSVLLGQLEIDEAAVAATVDPALYRTYTIDYLLCPETDPEAESALNALRDAPDWNALSHSAILCGCAALCAADQTHLGALYDVAAALNLGETSEVIRTDYGLFLLRLTDTADETAYLAAVENALYEARCAAFAADANALYADAEYTINVAFWDSVTLGSARTR